MQSARRNALHRTTGHEPSKPERVAFKDISDYDPRKPEYVMHISQQEANSYHAALLRRQIGALNSVLASRNDDVNKGKENAEVLSHYETVLKNLTTELNALDLDEDALLEAPVLVEGVTQSGFLNRYMVQYGASKGMEFEQSGTVCDIESSEQMEVTICDIESSEEEEVEMVCDVDAQRSLGAPFFDPAYSEVHFDIDIDRMRLAWQLLEDEHVVGQLLEDANDAEWCTQRSRRRCFAEGADSVQLQEGKLGEGTDSVELGPFEVDIDSGKPPVPAWDDGSTEANSWSSEDSSFYSSSVSL